MNCRLVESRIDAYIDGELCGDEMLALRHHITSCSQCTKELDSLKRVKALVGGLPQRPPSPGLEDRLLLAIRAAKAQRHTTRGAWVRLAVHAAVAAVATATAMLAFSIFVGTESSTETGASVASTSDGLDRDQVFDQARNPLYGGIQVSLSRDPSGR